MNQRKTPLWSFSILVELDAIMLNSFVIMINRQSRNPEQAFGLTVASQLETLYYKTLIIYLFLNSIYHTKQVYS